MSLGIQTDGTPYISMDKSGRLLRLAPTELYMNQVEGNKETWVLSLDRDGIAIRDSKGEKRIFIGTDVIQQDAPQRSTKQYPGFVDLSMGDGDAQIGVGDNSQAQVRLKDKTAINSFTRSKLLAPQP
jgi:hypothetical protein